MSEVNKVNVPSYDELSVINLMPDLRGDPTFMQYMPDQLPKGRNCDREYFFDVLHTVHAEYLEALITHAAEQRNTANSEHQ